MRRFILALALLALLFCGLIILSEDGRQPHDYTRLHMKQIGLGLQNYYDAHKEFPLPFRRDANGQPLLSWRVHILPYMEEQALYDEFHLNEPWDSEHNKRLIARMPDVYVHSLLGDLDNRTVFLMPRGDGIGLDSNTALKNSNITDRTSQTIAVVEANPDRAVVWTAPDDLPIHKADPTQGLGHVRSSGTVTVLYIDGHVGTIDAKFIDPKLLNALYTRQGGEPTNVD